MNLSPEAVFGRYFLCCCRVVAGLLRRGDFSITVPICLKLLALGGLISRALIDGATVRDFLRLELGEPYRFLVWNMAL
jgi:hypothetical protein